MSEKMEQILKLVAEYITEKTKDETWEEGDWVKYSGPHFDEKEYQAAIKVLLSGWLIFGENSRKFEKQFPEFMGKKHGVLTNSGSSANLLMTSVLTSKNKLPEKYREAVENLQKDLFVEA